MSNCCSTVTLSSQSSSAGETCHHCHKKGRSVGLETVKALLSVSSELIHATSYYFCDTQSCPVVYFAADGQQVFTEADVRERVHQKAPLVDDVFVCYCFRHTPRSLRKEVATIGHSTAVTNINEGIRAGLCACEIRNPQGSCCLGNVKAVLHQIVDIAQTHFPI
jgi:hypothetical protein